MKKFNYILSAVLIMTAGYNYLDAKDTVIKYSPDREQFTAPKIEDPIYNQTKKTGSFRGVSDTATKWFDYTKVVEVPEVPSDFTYMGSYVDKGKTIKLYGIQKVTTTQTAPKKK